MAKFDLSAYKKKKQIADTPKKKEKHVILDKCMHSVLGMPGIPLGHITQIYGLSDTGKTSLLFHAAARAQKQGVLPVVIVTEGKVDWNRARAMGFQYTGDLSEEEQEEDFCLVEEGVETLEQGFEFILGILNDVEMGNLPYDVLIFWDSIGNTVSENEIEIKKDGTIKKKDGMMVAARAISSNMRNISRKVNNSNKVSHPNYAGLVFINHAYTEPPAFPGGPSTVTPYGGKKIWYSSSLVLKTSRRQKLSATKDGVKMGFGIVSKIQVDKNHLTNTAHSGEFVITADRIIPNEKSAIDSYKKETKDQWGVILDENDEKLTS